MERDEWRKGRFELGEKWKSTEVCRCVVCGSKSNEYEMAPTTSMSTGPMLVMKCLEYAEHAELEEALVEHKRLWRKIRKFKDALGGEPNPYVDLLEKVRDKTYAKVTSLRSLFKKYSQVLDNVQGIDIGSAETSLAIQYTKTKSGGGMKTRYINI